MRVSLSEVDFAKKNVKEVANKKTAWRRYGLQFYLFYKNLIP